MFPQWGHLDPAKTQQTASWQVRGLLLCFGPDKELGTNHMISNLAQVVNCNETPHDLEETLQRLADRGCNPVELDGGIYRADCPKCGRKGRLRVHGLRRRLEVQIIPAVDLLGAARRSSSGH